MTTQQQPQNPMDDLVAFRNKRLTDEINDITSSLNTVADSDITRLSEYYFKEVFLPFFAGDKEPKYPVTLTHWLNVATSAYKPVHVVDESNTVLFTVPAVYNREVINPISQAQGPSIAHVVMSAQQYTDIHPARGMQYLNAELTKRALVMKVPANVLRDLETWNAIFSRYGRPSLMDAAKDKNQTASNSTDNNKEDAPLDYDDFEPL